MPIPVSCSGCGKRFNAPDRGAGRKVPCPACQTVISIPLVLADDEEDEYRLADEPEPVTKSQMRSARAAVTVAERHFASSAAGRVMATPAAVPTAPNPPAPTPSTTAPPKKGWVPPTRSSTPSWLRHLHWCLALAMIPLAVSMILPDREDDLAGIVSAEEVSADESAPTSTGPSSPAAAEPPASGAEEASAEEQARIDEILSQLSPDELLATLPGHKLPGAFLARDTWLHWLFAVIAATTYMIFFIFLASDKCAQPLHLLGLGLFTATGGILLLLFVQLAATVGVVRVRGAGGFIVLVLALIGLSYSAAVDPDSGLIASFIGFTLGIGLCEEVCKALPILFFYRIGITQNWRGAFLWGLASGAGFGVAEGVMYSQDFYNGVAGPGIYVVRFVSCVALHAIWAGSIGIAINQRQDLLQEDWDEWWWYALAVLRLIAVPMVLHGLYDTLLKKELDFLALLTAAASFGYLAWQISHLRGSDDEDERAAYVAGYIRAKAAAQGA